MIIIKLKFTSLTIVLSIIFQLWTVLYPNNFLPASHATLTQVIDATNSSTPTCTSAPVSSKYAIKFIAGTTNSIAQISTSYNANISSNSPNLRIYTDSSGVLGSFVGTLTYASVQQIGNTFLVTYTGNISVTANNIYWVEQNQLSSTVIASHCYEDTAVISTNSWNLSAGNTSLWRWRLPANPGFDYMHWSIDFFITGSGTVAPSNSVLPTISGTTTFGGVLTATAGTWSGSPTFAYQWQRASSLGGSYTNIAGGTSSSYTLVTADVAQFLRVNVNATNAGGSASALSLATAQVSKASQASLTLALSASSKTFPYSQLLTLTPSGGTGTGATTFAIFAGGSAASCTLSASSSPATLTATTTGTCFIQTTKAADSNYNIASSSSQIFTFSKANNSLSFANTSFSSRFGETLTVLASGLGTGAVTYAKGSSTACDVNTAMGVVTITASSGTCLITATIGTDANYLTANSSNTVNIIVAQGLSAASLTFAPGELIFRTAKTITVVTSIAGRVTFRIEGKRLPRCINLRATAVNSFTVTCSYKPSTRNQARITATLNPESSSYTGVFTQSALFNILPRTNRR